MNIHWYKTFFISALTVIALVSTGQSYDVSLLTSESSGVKFELSIDVNRLDSYRAEDSSIVYFLTVQVGMPYGASVTIGNFDGRSLVPFEAGLQSPTGIALNQSLISLSSPITLRGRQMVSVNIYPVTPRGIYREVEIGLNFSGGNDRDVESAADPHFERIFRSCLINYESFRSWPAAARPGTFASKLAPGPFSADAAWAKIGVQNTGLIRVTGAQLQTAGMLLDQPSVDLHLYYGGGLPIPVQNDFARPQLEEIDIKVYDGGDGLFGISDYLLFYGEHVDRWRHQPVDTFINNNCADHNVYWLAQSNLLPSSGLRMLAASATPTGLYDTTITTFTRRVHVEQDNVLRKYRDGKIFDYYRWFWTNESSLTFFVSTPGMPPGGEALLVLRGRSFDPSGLTVNGIAATDRTYNNRQASYKTLEMTSGLNEITTNFLGLSSVQPYFDNLEAIYSSPLSPSSDRLLIALGDFSGRAAVKLINQYTATPIILDISDRFHPIELTEFTVGALIEFERDFNATGGNIFFVSTESAAFAPLYVVEARPVDLRVNLEQADLIIITVEELVDALDEYIYYRQGEGFTIKVVTVNDIMDNFGWGVYDPIAIRDYLKFAYENYPAPAPYAALFVGDGSYDYLNHLGTNVPNLVPPFLNPIDNPSTSSDDNYVYFGRYGIFDSDSSYHLPDRGYDMMTARWPAAGVNDIATVIDKIKKYESASGLGRWRTNIALVADDELGESETETIHVTDTEKLAKYHIPGHLNVNKIYLWDYPLVNGERPDVNREIIKNINEGTLLVNYVGHGNPNVWAHEHVFRRKEDIPQLDNGDRLPVVYAASCAIGFFDDPQRIGLAEALLFSPDAGAIATISATRLVYSSPNHTLNVAIFDELLFNDSLTVCEAVYVAKLKRQYLDPVTIIPNRNDRNFLYFGDPLLKMGLPREDIELTTYPTSMTALKPVHVVGRLVDQSGSAIVANGSLSISVFDSNREKQHFVPGAASPQIDYEVTGPTIFRGQATITDGDFDFTFVPPLDIGYGGRGARVSLYATFGNVDAAGLVDSIQIADSIANFTDAVGPIIEYGFVGRDSFVSGDLVPAESRIEITLSDSSGINLAGGIGHGIMLEIDGKAEGAVNLTSLFEYDRDDYTTGSLEYALTDLSPGVHIFRVKAWDNANNPSLIDFTAEIVAVKSLALLDFLNYPNPMSDSTTFSFTLTQPVEQLSLRIFTLSGRLIKSFDRYSLNPSYYDDIVWDGRDYDGDRVATGVYLYKATALSPVTSDPVELFGKLVVIN